MEILLKNIDRQIAFNQGKNLLHNKPGLFRFIAETTGAISQLTNIDNADLQILIDYSTDEVVEEFCRVNQYYSISTESKAELREIYAKLFNEIKTAFPAEAISHAHFNRLRNWLIKYNAFASDLYRASDEKVEPVACSEYTAQLQIKILHLDTTNIMQPVLDIGCGKQGILIAFLEDLGIESCGIDRFHFTRPNLFTADWLEYGYGVDRWGTIVSHLGFTNHFCHHNLREDGNYVAYGRTYMNILQSLKIGGSFHYAPGVPFIEKYLDDQKYALKRFRIKGHDFKTTVVKRLV